MKAANGKWVCPECVNDHIARKRANKSAGGIVIPDGVKPDDYFAKLFPNRRARRAR